MSDFRDETDFPNSDEDAAADAALSRATERLRSMPAPPMPADIFAEALADAGVAPAPRSGARSGGRSSGPWRFSLAVAASLAVIAVVVFGFAALRYGPFARPTEVVEDARSPDLTRRSDDVAVARQAEVGPHPHLRTLALRTADLKARVVSLRLRVEATAARRQADRLLEQYARIER